MAAKIADFESILKNVMFNDAKEANNGQA